MSDFLEAPAAAVICESEEGGRRGMEPFPRLSLQAGGGSRKKRAGTNGNGERKMKYHPGLNNVGPCGECSPHGALIAFISIPFMASSPLSCREIETPSR